jgi:hypothetical protein
MPLALLDNAAARTTLPRVIELMAAELGWDDKRSSEEAAIGMERLSVAI